MVIFMGGRSGGGGLFIDPLGQHRRQQHENAASHHGVNQVGAEIILHQRPKGERGDDFRKHDEEIKNSHVNAHSFRRQRARKNGVGHGKNGGPRHAAKGQREQQQSLFFLTVNET